jgi:hypothetical protein
LLRKDGIEDSVDRGVMNVFRNAGAVTKISEGKVATQGRVHDASYLVGLV